MAAAAGSAAAYSLLEIERDRLHRALAHLERSVRELKATIAESGPDPDYRDAINENVVVIAKQKARIAALDDEIKRARGVPGDVSLAQLATLPIHDSNGSMARQQQQDQQRQQHARMAPPAAHEPAAQQQEQQQQPDRDAEMEDYADHGSSGAAGAQAPADAAAAAAAGGSTASAPGDHGLWL